MKFNRSVTQARGFEQFSEVNQRLQDVLFRASTRRFPYHPSVLGMQDVPEAVGSFQERVAGRLGHC